MNHREYARELIETIDAYRAGEVRTEQARELHSAVFEAGIFAAQAFQVAPNGGADVVALARTFLIALSNPTDAQLDYLRADPAAGAVARDAAAQLGKITNF
ncbi:hypothetical protein VWZ88_01295 [Phaeobacter sp. JH20_36]|uniref:hypothetical protein n=1 Tax=unclassified Phaeobacter TaxID=2621772 RepID=UPI003A875480